MKTLKTASAALALAGLTSVNVAHAGLLGDLIDTTYSLLNTVDSVIAGVVNTVDAADIAADLALQIRVVNLDTGEILTNGATITGAANIQVKVLSNNINCAGQYAVTTSGSSLDLPTLPSLRQVVPFVIDTALGNTILGQPLSLGAGDVKIAATCSGLGPLQHATAYFELFVQS
ncbi:MAG: hypothetical protein ACU84J_01530 [Gammaproteobacteria bacterium]